MELPSNLLEQIAFNTRPKIEEHMLIVMDKCTHEEHLSQPLQTNDKHYKIAVTFLFGYNGIFNVTISHKKIFFKTSNTDKDFIQFIIPHGAYEIESFNNEIKRIITAKGHYSENEYPFTIKPNFTTLGSIIEKLLQGPIIGFVFKNNIGNLLGFHETILWEKFNLSPIPVDILSFDDVFLECDTANGMTVKGKRSCININFTMDVDPGYKYLENFRESIQWFMMESKDVISSNNFIFKNEHGNLVSFNGHSVTFRLSIKETSF